MTTDNNYMIFGFIEYLPISMGFLSPVFQLEDRYFVQRSYDNHTILSFDELPDIYINYIKPSNTHDITRKIGDKCIFCFKGNTAITIGEAKELSQILKETIDMCIESKHAIRRFINMFAEELVSTKKEQVIWEFCLNMIGQQSKIFRKIFNESLIPERFENNTLFLSNTEIPVRIVLQKQFLPSIMPSLINEYGSTFNIIVQDRKKEVGLHLYNVSNFSSETLLNAKNFLRSPSKPLPGMTLRNFIIGNHNKLAFNKVSGFVNDESNSYSRALLLLAPTGMGKTHLLNAIVNNQQKEEEHPSIILYSSTFKFPNIEVMHHSVLSSFEEHICSNDVIIIDDAHHIFNKNNNSKERLITLIVAYINKGKKFIFSYNTPQRNRLEAKRKVENLLGKPIEVAMLNKPDNEDKIRIFEYKSLWHSPPLPKCVYDTIPDNIENIEKLAIYMLLMNDIDYLPKQNELEILKISRQYLRTGRGNTHEKMGQLHNTVRQYFKEKDSLRDLDNISPRFANVSFITVFMSELLVPDRQLENYSYRALLQIFFENRNFRKFITNIFKNIIDNGWYLSDDPQV